MAFLADRLPHSAGHASKRYHQFSKAASGIVVGNRGEKKKPAGVSRRATGMALTAIRPTQRAPTPRSHASRRKSVKVRRNAVASANGAIFEVDSVELYKAAEAFGFSEKTLRRAKERCGVKAERSGGFGCAGSWEWRLP